MIIITFYCNYFKLNWRKLYILTLPSKLTTKEVNLNEGHYYNMTSKLYYTIYNSPNNTHKNNEKP